MSEWTHIKGSCNSTKISMKKVFKHIIPYEYRFKYNHFDFEGSFDTSGISASNTIERIIRYVRSIDYNCKISIDAEISFP